MDIIVNNNILPIIYLIGCILAAYLLWVDYRETSYEDRCNILEAVSISLVGILLSWITIGLYYYKDHTINK